MSWLRRSRGGVRCVRCTVDGAEGARNRPAPGRIIRIDASENPVGKRPPASCGGPWKLGLSNRPDIVEAICQGAPPAFTAPSLVPAPGYKVTVTAQGFSGYEVRNLELKVFHLAEFAILVGMSLRLLPSDVGTREAILQRYGISP